MKTTSAEEKALRMELIISDLLRWGVLASLVLIAGGTLLCFARSTDYGFHGGSPEDLRRLLAPGPSFPRTAGWLAHGLAKGDGAPFVVAGLLLLIATPVLRVAVSIVTFAATGERVYVLITSVVLALLALSFILGKAG